MIFIRSLLYNILYVLWTAFACIWLLWTLPLPRKVLMVQLDVYFHVLYWLQKYVIGLDFEVRGWDKLPEDGAFILAAKHQSMYETQILPHLMNDPAIILKKELMLVPFWGWYAWKIGHIAVDRGNRKKAMASIYKGVERIKREQRPLVIFPQGTRVKPGVYVPYKYGVAQIYRENKITIVPMALNSGLYWGRNSFVKKPGKVILEILDPIEPGMPPKRMMEKLETEIEEASNRISAEAGGPVTDYKAGKASRKKGKSAAKEPDPEAA